MKRFKLSPEAASDIREIWAYIAADSPRAARKVRLQIFEACQKLAENPHMGHNREDLTDLPVPSGLSVPTSSSTILSEGHSKSFGLCTVHRTSRACERFVEARSTNSKGSRGPP